MSLGEYTLNTTKIRITHMYVSHNKGNISVIGYMLNWLTHTQQLYLLNPLATYIKHSRNG